MLISRNGQAPVVHPLAVVAASAQVVGNVTIGARCFVDHNVVIASSGPPVAIDERTIVLANAVVRSTGGEHRPAFPVRIGAGTLVAPLCVLTGCEIGRNCYVATGVIVLQGARVGDDARVGVGAIVHAGAVVPPGSRVGLRHVAVPDGDGLLVTPDPTAARERLAGADFFGAVFEEAEADQAELHRRVHERLLTEVLGWHDDPLG
jgi:carbonic anhydrase/acetyltransferase-like protein (isoleucine patch superfamily)